MDEHVLTPLEIIAYQEYKKWIKESKQTTYSAQWWFIKNPELFEDFYKLARIKLRGKKIDNILKCKKDEI